LRTAAGIQAGDLGLYMPAFFLFFFLHPMPYSIPSFLNVTVIHYSVFAEAVYSQTSNWLFVG
jgi:hypothetical protein